MTTPTYDLFYAIEGMDDIPDRHSDLYAYVADLLASGEADPSFGTMTGFYGSRIVTPLYIATERRDLRLVELLVTDKRSFAGIDRFVGEFVRDLRRETREFRRAGSAAELRNNLEASVAALTVVAENMDDSTNSDCACLAERLEKAREALARKSRKRVSFDLPAR